MKTTKQIATIILIILLGVIAYGLFRTGRSKTASQMTAKIEQSQAAHGPAIDQSSLDAARKLVQMPTSADELPFAQEALRIGDREMDLAFAAAVSDVREHPAVLTAEAKQIQARLQNAENSLDRDKARADQLTTALAKATGAKQDAEAAAAAFTTKRAALQSSIKTKTQEVPEKVQSGTSPRSGPLSDDKSTSAPTEAPADLFSATRRRSAAVKALTNADERIEDQTRLAETYRQWMEVVNAQEGAVIHRGLRGAAIIVAILLIGIFFDSWLKSLLGKVKLDPRQAETLHAVISTALQIIALGLILLVIFGPPGQLGTFLGLAGAGLTVALKDFIVSFFGWFVLMGKNGMGLGDWVEINGVTGEMAELGMFHTVLLETGNWTDSGHPTGRRVTFTNSFAIEGHYFNFSTSGQWLWDVLTLVLASSQNPYPIVDAIQKAVLEATAEGAGQAEKEWQHAAHSRAALALSSAPAINVKPVIGGVEIAVRYVARANERYQLRAKLYQAAVDLLAKSPAQVGALVVPAIPTADLPSQGDQ